jgi:hypothetical protein
MTKFIRSGEASSLGTAALLSTATWVTLSYVDFLFYSSEIVPIALAVLFCVVFAGLRSDVAPGPRLAACGLIAAALPFAKLQSLPFALVFEAACLIRLAGDMCARRAGTVDVVWWVAGSVAPILVLVAPLYLVGEQDSFLTGYLGLASGYAGKRRLDLFQTMGTYIVPMAILWTVTVVTRREPGLKWQARLDLIFISAGLWPAAFLAVWLPGRQFPHYQWFLVFVLPLSVLLAQYAFPLAQAKRHLITRLAMIVFVVALSAMAPFRELKATQFFYGMAAAEKNFRSPGVDARPLFAWTGVSAPDTILLWGWEPELTAFSGLRSADRAAHAEYLIRPNPGRDFSGRVSSRICRRQSRQSCWTPCAKATTLPSLPISSLSDSISAAFQLWIRSWSRTTSSSRVEGVAPASI